MSMILVSFITSIVVCLNSAFIEGVILPPVKKAESSDVRPSVPPAPAVDHQHAAR